MALALYVGISLGVFIAQHSADPLQQNVATWAREHRLGFVVNRMERWLHSDPPSEAPAESLALGDSEGSVETIAPTSTAVTTTAPVATVTPGDTPATNTSMAPTTTIPAAPAPLAVPINPALEGEGEWRVLAALGSRAVIWGSSIRPLQKFGSVVATVAVIEQTALRAGLFNGTEIPGKRGWNNGNHIMAAARPSLIAAFNGGFRLEHFKGGYITEGRVIRKMRENEATLAIDKDGLLHVGVWGKDLLDDGSWVSLRQNLPPVVMDGKPSIDQFPGTYWGDDFHQVTFTYRSAICSRSDGRLMYVAVGKVDIDLLAEVLVNLGCVNAMELDINGNWPQFTTYKGFGTDERKPQFLDKRMGNGARYLHRSEKDFIALFDPASLPAGVVK